MMIDTSHVSPNRSSRDGALIRLIVLHATVGSAASSLTWLTEPASRVSTHYLIDKAGYIYQLVPDDQAAWHAGKSAWLGLDSTEIQQQSIGVELENRNDGRDPYPPAQLDAATGLCRQLISRYVIVPDMVVRHLDIAMPRGRKTDPAGFPWDSWHAGLFLPAPPADPFQKWGTIGHPTGAATGFAVPRAWLMNQKLGACVAPETYSASGKYSVTEFEAGLIVYYRARNTTEVRMF